MDNVLITLHGSKFASLKEVRSSGRGDSPEPGYSSRPHVVMPLAGSFVWHDGRVSRFADAQHVLFVAAREYRVSHPVSGDASLVIVPGAEFLEQLSAIARFRPDEASARLCSAEALLIARRLLWLARGAADPLVLDELILALFGAFGARIAGEVRAASSSRRLVETAKEYLAANLGGRITLNGAAAAADANPIYLSNLFRKLEGVPLHRYLLRLRLANALGLLPDADDLTALAYDSGFAHHSHFTAAFRSRFGRSPRDLRKLARDSLRNGVRQFQVRPLCTARGGIFEPSEAGCTDPSWAVPSE